jgi:hypothetical protein
MTTNATAVLLDSDGVEMSEPVPAQCDDGKIRVDHVLYALREARAAWIEFRAPGREPLRAPIWRNGSRWVEPGDTLTFSPTSITVAF